MQSIILVRPAIPGNIGAVARCMKNFSLNRLVLVDPVCDHLGVESRCRAKHAQDVLESAVVVSTLSASGCDWFVATSGKLGSDDKVTRIPLTPGQLAANISSANTHVGIVFGPEDGGLSNEQIKACDAFVHIPSSESYPVLNLSHSVAIVCYELFLQKPQKVFTPMSGSDKEVLLKHLDAAVECVEYGTPQKRLIGRQVLHNLIGRSMLTRREAFALMGLFKKVRRESQGTR